MTDELPLCQLRLLVPFQETDHLFGKKLGLATQRLKSFEKHVKALHFINKTKIFYKTRHHATQRSRCVA
ncbi:hypothetical protein [Polaromonas sp.]|uniref:hypothetical protein n=1 Tax=Polaromonas sp. TaxID=1869339 RepID=UPI0013B882E3|nr:hypothetical protein [Polaromonas sp.]NDP64643.1 hypothetical protein [Polaromonas sp.]